MGTMPAKFKRRLFGGLAAAALVLLVLAIPAVHWRIAGWLSGEPFYQGRPSSYWRGEAAECVAGSLYEDDGYFGGAEWYAPAPDYAPIRSVRRLLQLQPPPVTADPTVPLPLRGDPAAVPVLIAMLSDRDAEVRCYAADALGTLGVAAWAALPELKRLVDDDSKASTALNYTVGGVAKGAIRRIEAGH